MFYRKCVQIASLFPIYSDMCSNTVLYAMWICFVINVTINIENLYKKSFTSPYLFAQGFPHICGTCCDIYLGQPWRHLISLRLITTWI